MIAAALFLTAALAAPIAAESQTRAPPPPSSTCDKPVLMVVAGQTLDRARMREYVTALADSRLYQRLGGYHLNSPRAAATFEGQAPPGYMTLIVRFPCLANAKAFWMSREYQERIKPLRFNPSGGDYIINVYPEAPLSEEFAGKVGSNAYAADFDISAIEQVPGATP